MYNAVFILPEEKMLELKNISFAADNENGEGQKDILKNVSLKIDKGFVAITGPNGGGKSTLAKIIAGIITPTSGQILLDGEDITALTVTERARKGISFAFQYHQFVFIRNIPSGQPFFLACTNSNI